MKPPPFTYHAPRELAEAIESLAAAGQSGGGKVLAGGQSLIPMLNMRLAAPAHIIDINRIGELDSLEVTGAGVRVGALARHAAVERSDEAYGAQPLLRQALRLVAHPVIRNRGTVVGSLAHADPAAELPAALALLGGTVEAAGPAGRRTIGAAKFFTGPLECGLAADELAVSAFFPALPPRAGTAFVEVARRHGDYAVAGAAALVVLDADLRVARARLALVSLGPVPVVVDVTEAAGGRPPGPAWPAAAERACAGLDPDPDIHAGAGYRLHLARVLAERGLAEAGRAARAATGGDQSRDGRP